LEERKADLALQLADGTAHRGLGDQEGFAGPGKAAVASDFLEELELAQRDVESHSNFPMDYQDYSSW
jgi:hypothetical protein